MEWRNTEKASQDNRTFSGVYTIRIVSDPGTAMPLGRIAKIDQDGVVYIGTGNVAVERVKAFHSEDFDHEAASAWSCGAFAFESEEGNPTEYQFEYSLEPESESGHEEDEKLAIWQYVSEFGEVPPLNSQVPGGKLDLFVWLDASR